MTLYERLGVAPDADTGELRAAYRRLARQLHPDVAGLSAGGGLDMALVNEAWRVLSDPTRRQAYDATLRWTTREADPAGPAARSPRPDRPRPPVGSAARPGGPGDGGWAINAGARREAWLAGLRLQIRRLGTQAARSATQTLVIRHRGDPRQPYEDLVDPIVDHLVDDTAERVRQARLAGAAPLDLAIAAALVGLRAYAEELVAGGGGPPSATARQRAAEMVDRMWDTMAHEVPRELAQALGGNPRAARHLRP